jgi:hypothetical protein
VSASTRAGRVADELTLLSGHQRVLRPLVGLAPPAVLGCALLGGAPFTWRVLVVVVALGLLCVAAPYSHAVLLTLAFLAWRWLADVVDPRTPWVVPAALAVLVLHTAAAASAGVPGSAVLEPLVRQRWLRRTAVVALASVGVWALTVVAGALQPAPSAVATLAAVALVALVAETLRRSGR